MSVSLSSLNPPTTISVMKTASEPSGLYLYKDQDNRIIVDSIYDNGCLVNTELKSSMEILSINGSSCEGMSATDVTALINEVHGQLIVIAREVIYEAFIVDTESAVDDARDVPMVIASTHDPEQVQEQLIYADHPRHMVPLNCSDGGEWAQIRYSGKNTFLVCFFLAVLTGIYSCCGLVVFLFPQDKQDVYIVDGKVS